MSYLKSCLLKIPLIARLSEWAEIVRLRDGELKHPGFFFLEFKNSVLTFWIKNYLYLLTGLIAQYWYKRGTEGEREIRNDQDVL